MAHASISRKNELPPLLQLTSFIQHLSDELLDQEVGISLSFARILGALSSTTPSSQRAIAVKLHQTEANVSRQLRVMHGDGLVRITKNKKDSRQRDVTLAAKGSRKYEQAVKLLQNQQGQMLKSLDRDSKKTFTRSISNLLRTTP